MKVGLLVLTLTIFLLASCTNFGDEEAELISCNVDGGIDPCSEGYTCYDSQIWPKGGEQGPQTGDLLCHQDCEQNSDCPTNFPNCENLRLARGDIEISTKFCVK